MTRRGGTGRPAGLRERARYRFDRFMERGTVALIAGLAAVSALIVVGVVAVLVLIGGDDGRDMPQLLWMSLLRTLDPGTMGQDDGSAPFVLGMLAVTLGGIFVISALIGILNTGLQAAAQGRDEVALGYRIAARGDDATAAYGVVLNPPRDAALAFGRDDRAVVLAER